MRLCLVTRNVLEEIQNTSVTSGLLWGRVVDDGDVIQVLSTSEIVGLHVVGSWVDSEKVERADDSTLHSFTLRVARTNVALPLEVETKGGLDQPEVRIVDIGRVFERVQGVLQMDKLADKRVLIAGVGSGGSRVALELAKSGIGTMVLVDHERLEIENIVRHECGIIDLGRYKTRAVRDLVLNHNPTLRVICHEFDIASNIDRFRDLIKESDLVISATGSPKLNNMTNDLCVQAHVPAIFAGVWEKASGGFVMRYIPNETPCFNCVHGIISGLEPKMTRSIDYSSIDDLGQLRSEPGLSINIGFIPLLQSKLAILTLLNGIDKEDIPHHLIVWLNRGEGQYPSLTLLKAKATKREDCLTCGKQAVSG